MPTLLVIFIVFTGFMAVVGFTISILDRQPIVDSFAIAACFAGFTAFFFWLAVLVTVVTDNLWNWI